MKSLISALGVLAATGVFLGGLLWAKPFDRANDVLDWAFGSAPKWTQVENLVVDSQTQEVSRGEQPVSSLELLASYWDTHREAKRVVFIGNSQMQTMSLAPGEAPSTDSERTYVDQVSSYYKQKGIPVLCYRLSAPGLSYAESLWYVEYLLQNPVLKPDVLVLQINYQAFWNGSIRESLVAMLKCPAFAARIRELSKSRQPYAEYFREALVNYSKPQAETASDGNVGPGFGEALERRVRLSFVRFGLQAAAGNEKNSIEQMLYRCRLYFLRLKPSTARSISGPRLLRSQSAIEALAETCRDSGVKLVLFTAPLNPRVSLYKNDQDKAAYESFVEGVAQRYNLALFHLDDAVEAQYWGRLLNSPDPLHMGRRGHQIVAAKMIDVLQKTVHKD